jgi:Flp pilus assembly pilin Flp
MSAGRSTLDRVRRVATVTRPRHQDGQALVEYGLLIAAGALVVIVAMLFLAGSVDRLFRDTGSQTGVYRPPVVQCDGSYEAVCIPPPPPDLNCADIVALGIPTPVKIVGADPHHLDHDGNGFGC